MKILDIIRSSESEIIVEGSAKDELVQQLIGTLKQGDWEMLGKMSKANRLRLIRKSPGQVNFQGQPVGAAAGYDWYAE